MTRHILRGLVAAATCPYPHKGVKESEMYAAAVKLTIGRERAHDNRALRYQRLHR